MGKGDRKTAKGKRYNSSYGNARGKGEAVTADAAQAAKRPAAKAATKAPAKKAVAKKAAS